MGNELLLLAETVLLLAACAGAIVARRGQRRAEQALSIAESTLEAVRATLAEEPPTWGTQERKRWHARQRDFHAAKVVEAGTAAKQKESE